MESAQPEGPAPPQEKGSWGAWLVSLIPWEIPCSPSSILSWLLSPTTPIEDAPSPSLAQAQAMPENEPQEPQNEKNQPIQEELVLKEFTIQVCVSGRTGHCEKNFLKNLTDHLIEHGIDLKKEDYREDSNHFLLIFCPVASRVGTDMENAMEGFQGEPKAVLIMMHHRPKEYDHFVDTKLQAKHPAVVRTVHTRYTLEDGFYDCEVNKEAVEAVAEVLKNHSKEGQEDPASLGTTVES